MFRLILDKNEQVFGADAFLNKIGHNDVIDTLFILSVELEPIFTILTYEVPTLIVLSEEFVEQMRPTSIKYHLHGFPISSINKANENRKGRLWLLSVYYLKLD